MRWWGCPRERAGDVEGKEQILDVFPLWASTLCSSSLWICCVIHITISSLIHVDRKWAWLRRSVLDYLGRYAAPKGDLKSTSPSEEAILVWDQLQRVGKRNLAVATFLSWQVDLCLQRFPPSFRKLHMYLCKLHKNVGPLCCSQGKGSVWVWDGSKQAIPICCLWSKGGGRQKEWLSCGAAEERDGSESEVRQK